MSSRREIVLAHAQAAAPQLAGVPDLEQTLEAKLAEAHQAWPTIVIPDEAFLRHLGEKLATAEDPVSTVQKMYAADLYLAFGCAIESEQAVLEFENHYMAAIEKYLRSQALRSTSDEIKQTLRVRLLMPDGPTAPRISQYTGQGPLGAWLRAAA